MEDLPIDVIFEIAVNLPLYKLNELCRTNKFYQRICNDDNFWFFKLKHDYSHLYLDKINKMAGSWKQTYIYIQQNLNYIFRALNDYDTVVINFPLICDNYEMIFTSFDLPQVTEDICDLSLDKSILIKLFRKEYNTIENSEGTTYITRATDAGEIELILQEFINRGLDLNTIKYIGSPF